MRLAKHMPFFQYFFSPVIYLLGLSSTVTLDILTTVPDYCFTIHTKVCDYEKVIMSEQKHLHGYW